MNQPVRVAVESFAPINSNAASFPLIRASELVLPDNTPTTGLRVFFEGVLLEVTREIGVVHVRLGPPPDARVSTEGWIQFRGQIAVIIRGPAIVRLAVPFYIEPIPTSECNYWQDLRLPQVQFNFNFDDGNNR